MIAPLPSQLRRADIRIYIPYDTTDVWILLPNSLGHNGHRTRSFRMSLLLDAGTLRYERCSCSCSCHHIFRVLKHFHFTTDRRQTSQTD